MFRLTKKDVYWFNEELWTSAEEPDEDEINAVYFVLKNFEDLQEQNLLAILPAKI